MTSALDKENAYFQPDILLVGRQTGGLYGVSFAGDGQFSPGNLTIHTEQQPLKGTRGRFLLDINLITPDEESGAPEWGRWGTWVRDLVVASGQVGTYGTANALALRLEMQRLQGQQVSIWGLDVAAKEGSSKSNSFIIHFE